ncbi:MAG: hypothetical protein Q4B55_05260 [Lachnospiraceae bacterium]|nr:hypothetical protein [Lachnospiraceae bacterium]
MKTRWIAPAIAIVLCAGLCACGGAATGGNGSSGSAVALAPAVAREYPGKQAIEEELNLTNMDSEWTYSANTDSWTLSPVTAVVLPEIENEQGVSVCVPGAYVKGLDTNGDGKEDTFEGKDKGDLIIDYDASITSTNGQVYTAATAPVIINTGAAGYSEQQNQNAGSTYAAEGYINVACGNRGKQSTMTDANGNTIYTGDAPCCLVDQKNAVRFIKYNILLGNLPGSVDYFVSTGGSGGGAHATMLAATSNHPDFYDYEIKAGAVGVYKNDDGSYSTAVTIDGQDVEISDGMWGCMAYSAITSLAQADMAMAFEYYLDSTYSFNTDFQKQMAEYLAEEYAQYIYEQGWSVDEAKVGFDIDGNGSKTDVVDLSIQKSTDAYGTETNGFGGTYLNLYLAEFEQSLTDYLDRLAYAEDWTWFGSNGAKYSDGEAALLSKTDKIQAFLEGRYAKGNSGNMMGGPGGGFPPDFANGGPPSGGTPMVGTPDAGTTQSASSQKDSANYASFDEMVKAYKEDIAEVEAGDDYGNNIVELYDPMNYIGAEGTSDPTWSRILMGASEGDISMLNSLNLEIAWLNAGTDANIEWQWDGGHVPSEILGDSFALYVDTMYGKHVDGAVQVTKAEAVAITTNGDATEASGTDISGWVSYDENNGAGFSLADIAAYRTAGASKAIPGFDVMDYGQEDYVFGSSTKDARHWNKNILEVFEGHADTLAELFNGGK